MFFKKILNYRLIAEMKLKTEQVTNKTPVSLFANIMDMSMVFGFIESMTSDGLNKPLSFISISVISVLLKY